MSDKIKRCRVRGCGRILYYIEELEYGYCAACLDAMPVRYQEGRKWRHYHNED